MSRHLLTLTRGNRAKAVQGVQRAPDGWVLELREPKRSDPQNSALWGLLNQIQRQRPTHNGVQMTPELWKAVFMDALGSEMTLLPRLDGQGYFPAGHRSSKLTKGEFAELLTLMLAWCAEQGLTVEHFEEAAEQPALSDRNRGQDGTGSQQARSARATGFNPQSHPNSEQTEAA